MEEPVFIKCEPGCLSGTAELNNADHDVKLPAEEQTNVKTEPEEPFIKEELEIQDVKIEPFDEENNASVVSLNKNHTLPACHKLQPATCRHNKSPYQSTTNLKQILVIHSGQKPHQLPHSGQKNYICLTCGSRFSVRAGWKSHLSTHSEDKPYKCLLCGKAFERKQCVKRHMNVHATPGPNSSENDFSQLKILKRPFYINK